MTFCFLTSRDELCYGVTNVSNVLQALGPFGPFERTRQYSTVPAGRFASDVMDVFGASTIAFMRRVVKVLLVETSSRGKRRTRPRLCAGQLVAKRQKKIWLNVQAEVLLPPEFLDGKMESLYGVVVNVNVADHALVP